MRTFFALDLPAKDKLAIDSWRDKALPTMNGKVPAANFHITLAFLGNTTEHQLDSLCQFAGQIECQPFSLHFNHMGYWSKPQITWLGCDHTPEPLETLSKQLHSQANVLRMHRESKTYVPHISLFRRCETSPPAAIIAPDFDIKMRQFGLYQSIQKQHGVDYHCIQQWPLIADIRPRNR